MSEKKQPSKYPPVFLTVWQDAWTALTQPRQYVRWAFQPFSRSVKYLAILNAVLAVVATAYFFITLKPAILQTQSWVRDNVPVMTWKSGELSIEDEQAFTFTDSDEVFIKVDPTQSSQDDPHIDNFYEVGLLLTSDSFLFKDDSGTETVTWKEIGINDLAVSGELFALMIQRLLDWAPLWVPLAVFLYLMAARLFFTAFFSVILYLVDGTRFSFTQLWSMAIYATTPAVIAGYIGFVLGSGQGLYTAAFLVYFIFAYFNYLKFKLPKRNLKG